MDFANLPLNTSRVYAAATAKSGCIVYVPAIDNRHAASQRYQLLKFLSNQPEPPPKAA